MTEKQVLESTSNNLYLLKFRAEEYRKLGKHNEALEYLNQLLGINPNNPYLLKFRARTYRKLGMHHEALYDLNRFLGIYPNDRVVLRFQGEVMIDILTKLLKMMKMNPNNEEKILYIRAQAYIKIEKYDEALVDLNRLINLNNENEEILSIRAQAYTAIGKFDKASDDLNRVLKINPRNTKALECYVLMNTNLLMDEESSYYKFKNFFDA
ncbi:41841_t:CDS:1 [Gigaspora margarita]|uniref:41841_t:CDS:1 n=1 Tax=Gigaspora margarita TaxID=4874 RepID=A0ABN7W3G6_GIGMA|nr:41841_t:CDS:1 [Gigaspora margarita]